MRTSFKSSFVAVSLMAAAVFTMSVFAATPAFAKCTRLAFSVNDYGKDGPTDDAKRLLDKYIADWTGERGITGYQTGPKSVKCELFLDFIVFDEYTCRAEATVCWGGESLEPDTGTSASIEPDSSAPAESTADAVPTDTGASGGSPVSTGSVNTDTVSSPPSVSDSRYVTGP